MNYNKKQRGTRDDEREKKLEENHLLSPQEKR